ncbi:MAG: oligosaccharide flippase family protein [Clostridia bacterium]
MTKKKFLMQGTILTIIALVMRSTNMYFRSYLSVKIGAEGMGLYQLIFSVFLLATTLSTSGISLAVTRLVSSLIAKNKRGEIKSTVTKCLAFCLFLSLSISSIFFFCSDFIAINFLSNAMASPSLKILGLGLPFMSICTCIKGYFLAVDEGVSSGIADLVEQIITIGGTVVIFTFFPFENIETACVYAMIASTLGEISSFLIDFISMKLSLMKHCPKKREKSHGVIKSLSHIALPCTLSSTARSLLNTAENLLVPIKLQQSGLSYSLSMNQYGLLSGMAFPILYFPSALIGPFASLLIPKICREKELSHPNAVAYITEKAVGTAVSFGIITSAVFFSFSSLLADVFYQSTDAGIYIAILSPLVPLMYLDIVVDCLLKGLDQQLNSMKYNILDSSIRLVLVMTFMSIFAMKSYIVIIFISMILNASLSFGKVIKVTGMGFSFLKKLFYQIPLAISSIAVASLFAKSFLANSSLYGTQNKSLELIIVLSISYAVYGCVCLFVERKRKL